MYESTIISDDIGKINFQNQSDECFLLEPFLPKKIIVQIIDAEVMIEKFSYYESIEKDKQKRDKIKESLDKEICDYKLNKIEYYETLFFILVLFDLSMLVI
jgi:hypothetical protein